MNPHQLQLDFPAIHPVLYSTPPLHTPGTSCSGLVRKSQGTRNRLVEQRMLKDGERERERDREMYMHIF